MRLNVFGMKVAVLTQKDLTKNANLMGYFDMMKNNIVIDSDLKGLDYEVTFIHELLEAIWFRCSYGLAVDDSQKEIMIDQIAKVLCENLSFKLK